MTYEISNWPFQISLDQMLCMVMAKGDPIPAARARVTRFGSYTPASYRRYKAELSLHLKQAFQPLSDASYLHQLAPEDRRFGVRAFFYRKTFQRTDVDNLLKSVMDAGTSILWPDDSQVSEVFGRVFRGSDDPRVEILIYEVDPEGLSQCERCEKLFKPSSRRAGVRFCGNECRVATDADRREQGTCEHCGAAFTYPPSIGRFRPVRFCSRGCSLKAIAQRRRENYSPKLCVDCGKRVSRPEYERCQGCKLAQHNGHASIYQGVKKVESPTS